MKNHHFLFFTVAISFLVLFVSAPVQAQEARRMTPKTMELRDDQAVTSEVVPARPPQNIRPVDVEFAGDADKMKAEPAVMMLPVDADPELMRQGRPSQIEPIQPLQIQDRVQERDLLRQQREEQLRSMSRSERAKERMSDVAQRVEQLLAQPEREGGIGPEIREIARAHQDAQGELAESLSDVTARNRFAKFLVGPNRSALNDVRQEANQIDARIARLKASLTEIVDEEAQAEVEALIADLEGQRNDLLETVETENASFSMFGWVGRLFGQTN